MGPETHTQGTPQQLVARGNNKVSKVGYWVGDHTCVIFTPLSTTWVSTKGMPCLCNAFFTSETDLDCTHKHRQVDRPFESAANA